MRIVWKCLKEFGVVVEKVLEAGEEAVEATGEEVEDDEVTDVGDGRGRVWWLLL